MQLLLIAAAGLNGLIAQEKSSHPGIVLDEMVITGTRTGSSRYSDRNVDVISRDEMRDVCASLVLDAIGRLSLVDLRSRGVAGVQSDIRMRASTFSQTLILVDGIPIQNPQTAHHNCDIPVSLSDIERVEIRKAGSSSIYGSGAFGGVIHIITDRDQGNTGFLSLKGGRHETLGSSAGIGVGGKMLQSSFSLDYKRSDGHKKDLDYKVWSVRDSLKITGECTDTRIAVSWLDKDFGARNFYAPFPSEEKTRTFFSSAGSDISLSDSLTLVPRISYTRHSDTFILDRKRPDFFQSSHITDTLYSALEVSGQIHPALRFAAGVDITFDKIRGNGLGRHSKFNRAVFAELRCGARKRWMISPGLRYDFNTMCGGFLSSSVDAVWYIDRQLYLRAGAGRSFRAPDYTELYYASPANRGNAHLEPEKAWSYEAGIGFTRRRLRMSAGFFARRSFDEIDWIKDAVTDSWQAENAAMYDVRGVDISAEVLTGHAGRAQFLYEHAQKEQTNLLNFSKYASDFAEHNFRCNWFIRLPYSITAVQSFSYKTFAGRTDEKVFSVSLSKKHKRFTVFVAAENIFNDTIEYVDGVPGRQRYVESGLSFEF